jgi:hypothetical protein
VTFLSHDFNPEVYVDESGSPVIADFMAGCLSHGLMASYLAGPLVVGRLTDTLAGDMIWSVDQLVGYLCD